ncbi:MAG TPA: peptidoglycan DD-metalloendopeptidase family protein [Rubrobacteraceae bacterium]|nr:peptidoglycan DD-metalloendopeptidase family protein [Rubrobacteraceae bacterium]
MASYLSWTRAAYVFFVLAVLAALLKIGGAGLAQQKILAAESSDPETTIEISTPENTVAETTTAARPRAEPTPAASPSTEPSPKPIHGVPVKRAVAQEKPASIDKPDKPPVFYRPSGRSAAPSAAGMAPAVTGPVCGDLGNFPKSSKAIFPLSDRYFNSYEDTWGASRPQGGHEGTDLMVPAGTQEYAVTDGTIVPVSGANGHGWNMLGGYTVMLRADYDVGPIEAGDLFYYAHMQKPSALKIGTRVRVGQVIGYAGDTGQGPEVTSGLFPPHLHFGWYDTTGARTALDSGAMNPFPLLEWLRSNGGAVSGGSDAEYCKAPQAGPPMPSTGGGNWSYPTSPGVRPDLDTGSDDGRPSPVVKESETSAERAPGGDKEKPDRQKPDGRPENRPEGDQATEHPAPKPRPPEVTAPDVHLPKPPGAIDPPGTATPRPHKPHEGAKPAADPKSIKEWVDHLIETVTAAPDDARPKDRPGPEDDKRKKHPKKHDKHEKHPKREQPDRPKHQQRSEQGEDPACDDQETGGASGAEPCEETTGSPETTPNTEDTTPAEPNAEKATEPAPEDTVSVAPPPDEPDAAAPEQESGPEQTSGEGTTAQ